MDVPRELQALVSHVDLCEQLVILDEVTYEPGPPDEHLLVSGRKYKIVR